MNRQQASTNEVTRGHACRRERTNLRGLRRARRTKLAATLTGLSDSLIETLHAKVIHDHLHGLSELATNKANIGSLIQVMRERVQVVLVHVVRELHDTLNGQLPVRAGSKP